MTDPGSPLFDFVKTMAMLAGILMLAWAALRFWMPKLPFARMQQQQGVIEVIAKQPLEARKMLYVVRAGKTNLLIATSDSGVAFLQQIELEELPMASPNFAQRLRVLKNGATERDGA